MGYLPFLNWCRISKNQQYLWNVEFFWIECGTWKYVLHFLWKPDFGSINMHNCWDIQVQNSKWSCDPHKTIYNTNDQRRLYGTATELDIEGREVGDDIAEGSINSTHEWKEVKVRIHTTQCLSFGVSSFKFNMTAQLSCILRNLAAKKTETHSSSGECKLSEACHQSVQNLET